jgi:DNA-binding transcriptional regulator LsrR (DeoR family)
LSCLDKLLSLKWANSGNLLQRENLSNAEFARGLASLKIQQDFGGNVLRMMLDQKANEMGDEKVKQKLEMFSSHIGLQNLRTTKTLGSVWVIATNSYKASAVKMMLDNKLANCLVIDADIAQKLLPDIDLSII